MRRVAWPIAAPTLALILLASAPPVHANTEDSASRAQLPLARSLAREADAIVALQAPIVTPVDPAERPTRPQDYTVRGQVAACLEGLRPPAPIAYRLTAETPPTRLAAASHSAAVE